MESRVGTGSRTGAGRINEVFFVHVGSFVAVAVYFTILVTAEDSAEGVRAALPAALIVMTAYVLVAYARGLLKHFDFGLWPMFAVGTGAVYAGSETALFLFENYSSTILFAVLGLVAAVPPLLGFEPFTLHFARRRTPAWQQKTREFAIINRIINAYFALLFFAAAAVAAIEPHDFRVAVLYPNLLVFVAGIPSQFWLPPLYLKLVKRAPPETVEVAILGMPLSFDAKAAGDVAATIQFNVSGEGEADYVLEIGAGSCRSFAGAAPSPDLTLHVAGPVWLRIARGEVDGARALMDGQFSAEGDLSLLMRLSEWFPRSA